MQVAKASREGCKVLLCISYPMLSISMTTDTKATFRFLSSYKVLLSSGLKAKTPVLRRVLAFCKFLLAVNIPELGLIRHNFVYKLGHVKVFILNNNTKR